MIGLLIVFEAILAWGPADYLCLFRKSQTYCKEARELLLYEPCDCTAHCRGCCGCGGLYAEALLENEAVSSSVYTPWVRSIGAATYVS